jgi:lipopolysaccharide/colanic/teichoic acid biosynthesis glycosyltransferase
MSHAEERSMPHHSRLPGQRVFDVAIASIALLLTLPVAAILALAIVLETGRPVLYRGWRVGRNGDIFRIYKFRSMVVHADRSGRAITTAGDGRVTGVGRVMRRIKLDELPQLLNVLFGDMALVGPRPEHPNYVRLYTPEQRQVLGVRPGITGAASVRFRNEEELLRGADPEALYRTVVMPEKLRVELEYLERRSFWTDMGLLIATVAVLPNRPLRATTRPSAAGHVVVSHSSADSVRRSR